MANQRRLQDTAARVLLTGGVALSNDFSLEYIRYDAAIRGDSIDSRFDLRVTFRILWQTKRIHQQEKGEECSSGLFCLFHDKPSFKADEHICHITAN
jgi:hypothetical protein